MSKREFYFGGFVVLVVAVVIAAASYFSYRSHEYEVQKTKIEQEQETIRNEEDNQFWQKVIPWGQYEQEKEE